MPRHSKETFKTLFGWYASCALAGVASLFVVVGALRLIGVPTTANNTMLGMLLISPLLVIAMIAAWRRVEPNYIAQQVKAMLTSTSGLGAFERPGEERKWRRE
jgi:hypothetical protein